jgi:hypothetical protein
LGAHSHHDANGALALSSLIGLHGLKNSFELDVYAATQNFAGVKKSPKRFHTRLKEFKDVG